MPTIRLMWVEPPDAIRGWEGEVQQTVIDAGEIEPNGASNFPGPAGAFRLMPEEFWRTIGLDDAAPIFLHESYVANIEKWVTPLPDAAHEVAVVAKVRDAVINLVDGRLAADPKVLPVSSTVTSTEATPQGMTVVGRCIILSPAST